MLFKKSSFISTRIRPLKDKELFFQEKAENVMQYITEKCAIAYIPGYISPDKMIRPLILTTDIALKIKNKHGEIPIENLLINAHDWDYAITHVDKIEGKINLIKKIPNSKNFLLIGAVRINGYFILTHFETESVQGNELKSLLGRGDLV
jgi:hypothetical protein